jgi:signal transduction histidine kinase
MVVNAKQARVFAPTEHVEGQPRLVLRFALYAGVVLLAAGLAIAWVVNREVAGRAERTVENQARAVAEANLRSNLRPSDFTAPVGRERRAVLDNVFRRSILIPGAVGGRLIGRDGTITYAARHELIGTKVGGREQLSRVLGGAVERNVTHSTTWRGEKNMKVLRVLVPVRLTRSPEAIGALALDQDYRVVDVSIGDARGPLAAILALALLALYISLFPILHRVTRQLEARNRRLRQHADEREQLLESERAARAEAEAMQRLLARQNERLLELDTLKDEFISLVSHELRTPLTSIRGYLELLLDDGRLDAEQRGFLGIMDRNSNRLLGLVSDLLMLTQIEAGGLEFELGPVDLEEVVQECIETALPTAEASGIELGVSTERLPTVRGHRLRLVQVLDNLISNALKFTPRGGRVDVRLSVLDGAALIEVQDTGLGIAESEQEQLFERFFRSTRATQNAIPGTGLGLTISKAIVERHGGRIELESDEGVGTTVRVTLPLSTQKLAVAAGELAA